jgi:hypothetical protein
VTVYLTEEQYRWARRVAASAVDEGPALSASDVVRLALAQLKASGEDHRGRRKTPTCPPDALLPEMAIRSGATRGVHG